jgi:hypothetical protein
MRPFVSENARFVLDGGGGPSYILSDDVPCQMGSGLRMRLVHSTRQDKNYGNDPSSGGWS